MLGFDLDIWDYLTFVTLFPAVVAGVAFWVWLAGLPGRTAIARKHPEAEAVKLLGWAGLLPTIYPWVQAAPRRAVRGSADEPTAKRRRCTRTAARFPAAPNKISRRRPGACLPEGPRFPPVSLQH